MGGGGGWSYGAQSGRGATKAFSSRKVTDTPNIDEMDFPMSTYVEREVQDSTCAKAVAIDLSKALLPGTQPPFVGASTRAAEENHGPVGPSRIRDPKP